MVERITRRAPAMDIESSFQSDSAPTPVRPRKTLLARILSRGGLVTLLVIFLAGGFAYSQYQLRTVANPAYAQEQASKQTAQIVARVGRLMVLPVEMPQIATVADVEMLKKTQLFFLNAHNGDQVLVYTDRAIIYSPSLDKIINVGPITRDTTPAKPATTPTSTASTTKTK